MVEGFYDDNTSRFIASKRIGSEAELEPHEKQAIEGIRKRLSSKKFSSRDEILESIEYLENLSTRISQVLKNEESAGNQNWTLRTVNDDIISLFTKLRQLYLNFG